MFYSVLGLYFTDTGSVLEMIEGQGDPFDMSRKVHIMHRERHRSLAISEFKPKINYHGSNW